MKNSHNRHVLAGAVAFLCHSASAASLSPLPAELATSNEGNLYQGFGAQQLAAPTFFTANFEPFDESLGTLQSFTIRCRIHGELVGTASDAEPTGSAASSFGGTFSIGGFAFDGTGGPGGNGVANSGTPIDVEIGIRPSPLPGS